MKVKIESACMIDNVMFSDPDSEVEVPEPMTEAVINEVAERIAFGYVSPVGDVTEEVAAALPRYEKMADEAFSNGAQLPTVKKRVKK